MKKVIVHYDDKVQFFEGVTKIQFYNAFDMFSAKLCIYQGKKRTRIDVVKIIGFEVKES